MHRSFCMIFYVDDVTSPEIYTLSHTTLFRSVEVVLAESQPMTWRVVDSAGNPIAKAEIMTSTWRDSLILRGRWRTNEAGERSEEHTSELQSHVNLVCRLLLEKKK